MKAVAPQATGRCVEHPRETEDQSRANDQGSTSTPTDIAPGCRWNGGQKTCIILHSRPEKHARLDLGAPASTRPPPNDVTSVFLCLPARRTKSYPIVSLQTALIPRVLFYYYYWRIIALQNFVVFCQTSTWINHRYTHIPSLLKLPPISFLIPPHKVDTEPIFEFPEPYSKFPLAIYFTYGNVSHSFHTLPPLLPSPHVHKSILYVCLSIATL